MIYAPSIFIKSILLVMLDNYINPNRKFERIDQSFYVLEYDVFTLFPTHSSELKGRILNYGKGVKDSDRNYSLGACKNNYFQHCC